MLFQENQVILLTDTSFGRDGRFGGVLDSGEPEQVVLLASLLVLSAVLCQSAYLLFTEVRLHPFSLLDPPPLDQWVSVSPEPRLPLAICNRVFLLIFACWLIFFWQHPI